MGRWFSLQSVLIAVVAILFAASLLHPPAKSVALRSDTRVRRNELHITIHQDALEHDPIIGSSVENGVPGESTFRDTVTFVKWSVVDPGELHSRCVITISKIVSDQPDEYPTEDDPLMLTVGALADYPKPSLEQAYIIPCTEHSKSTRIAWARDSIVLVGHITEPDSDNSDDDNSSNDGWHFAIDEVLQAPRTTQLDDPGGSLAWATPSPSPKPWEVVNRIRPDGRSCFAALRSKSFGVAASSCGRAADDYAYAMDHISERGTLADVATAGIVSSLYRKAQSLAFYRLGNDSDSKDVFNEGKALLHAIFVASGCAWCQSEAKKSLRKYGGWPPRNYDV